MNTNLEKEIIAARHYMLGARLFDAIAAMDAASEIHTHLRRDGTPEFSHQLFLMHYLRTLNLEAKVESRALSIAFLHDVIEDYDVNVFTEQFEKYEIAMPIIADVVLMSKSGLSCEKYYERLAKGPVELSLVKGVDRIHNLSTASGAFTKEKLEKYLEETENYVDPLLKLASKRHREFWSPIENCRLTINALCRALRFVPRENHAPKQS